MAESVKTSTKKPVNDSTAIPLSDIFFRTLHFWPWIILSLFICVGIGVIYLLRTPEVYTTTASILIKDDSAGKSVGTEEFSDLGLFKNNTNIQNEITTLKSTDLMEEVVRRLDLDINYYLPGRFHKIVAYGTTLPIKISFPDLPENCSATFSVNINRENEVSISDLKYGETKFDKIFKGTLNDTIQTGIGPIIITPTQYYTTGKDLELDIIKNSISTTADHFRSQMTVAINNKEGSVIDLSISDQSTQRSQELLNTLINVYNEHWIRDKNQIAVSTSNFINERLGVIESELGHVDSDISSYKSEHLIPDVEAASSMYMSQNQQIQQNILDLNNQLQLTRYIKSYLGADSNNDKLLPTNTGIANVDIQSQISEYNDLVLQRNSLLSKSSDKNPIVIQLNEQMGQVRQAILASVDNTILALTTQIKSLQGSHASTTSKIASNPTQAKYLLSVERQQKVKESLYLFLLQKREENELSQAFTAYNTRIVNKPASFGPTAPKARNILLSSFLLGLAIPFGIVYLKETNNTKVRGRKDIKNLALPFLGEIPQDPKSAKRNKSQDEKLAKETLLVKAGKLDIINEAFRILRTNVEFICNSSENHNIIAITSFNPGSGKSFTSMNLAMAIALKGKRVLVIDGDMRHGSTSNYAGSPQNGLANYLSGATDDTEGLIVKEPECNSLDILPIGSIPPNPTELLESPRLNKLLKELKPLYDYIFIDCPPIEVVADAQIIDKCADRTFFVIRAGLFERSMLPELDNLYEEKKYRNMALILNGTSSGQGHYGYNYGYGYGYGYGYNHKNK